MSVRVMSRVWEVDLEHGAQGLLLALADHADDDGRRCYPSVPYLAWKTGYSESQVRRIMKQLRESGLIVPVANENGGRGNPVEYVIHLEKGSKKPPFIPKQERVGPETHGADLEAEDDDPEPENPGTVMPAFGSQKPSTIVTPFLEENPGTITTPFPEEKPSTVRPPFPEEKPSAIVTPFPEENPSTIVTAFPGENPSTVKPPFPEEKPSAIVTPFPEENPSTIVTAFPGENPSTVKPPFPEGKGSHLEPESLASEPESLAFSAESLAFEALKPSIAMTPEPLEPSLEPPLEPSGEPSVVGPVDVHIDATSGLAPQSGKFGETCASASTAPESPEESPPPAPSSPKAQRFRPPDYWGPLTVLEGYARRDYSNFVATLEATCTAQGVSPGAVVAAFSDYYAGNRFRHGWSDPVAALRRTLPVQISKLTGGNKSPPYQSAHERRIAAEKAIPIRPITQV